MVYLRYNYSGILAHLLAVVAKSREHGKETFAEPGRQR